MPNAVIYCRVSTKEQTHNLSLETQEKHCREYCKRQGWTVDQVFVEQGESAKTTNRREFQRLISYCQKRTTSANFLVVYSLSRFARDQHDHYVVRALLQKLKIDLRSVTEPIDQSPTGKFMEGVLASAAQFDNDIRAARTIVGMRAALEKGIWTFKAPIGYVKAPLSSSLEADPKMGPLVREAFELVATGSHSRSVVLNRVLGLGLRTKNGKKVSAQTFAKLLRNPIYAGVLKIPRWAIEVSGSFEPLVPWEIFQQVQAVLSGKRSIVLKHERANPDFPLRHFVQCDNCGTPLTGSWSKGRSAKYGYYHCPSRACAQTRAKKGRLEDAFLNILRQMQPKPEYLRLFRDVIQDVWNQRMTQAKQHRLALTARVKQLRERKDRLVEAYLYERVVDINTYKRQDSKLTDELALAEAEIVDLENGSVDISGVLTFAERVLHDSGQFWLDAPLAVKHSFQQIVFPQGIKYGQGGIRTAAVSYVFNVLRGSAKDFECLASPRGFEPLLSP